MGQVKNFRGTPEIVRKVLGSASSELRARVKWMASGKTVPRRWVCFEVRAAELRSSYTDFEAGRVVWGLSQVGLSLFRQPPQSRGLLVSH